ncbi:MAG: cyclophilin-like fold protein [Flavobacteriales bacterium]|nr:cyclophilin-like fold protein [Flavobacteriales bacterium]
MIKERLNLFVMLLILSFLLFSCSKDNSIYVSESTVQYTLTYMANGETSGYPPQAVTANKGSSIALSNGYGLSRTGYTFVEWNTNADGTGTGYGAGSSLILNSDITLYAKWNQSQSAGNKMRVTIGSTHFLATLSENTTVTAFKALLPLTLTMSDYSSNEKVTTLPSSLPTNSANPGTIETGDIMLWGSSSIVLFYKTFPTSYSYSRIGKIDNSEGFKAALGSGSVIVKFELVEQ